MRVSIVFAVMLVASGVYSQSDFSGKWKLNKGKSEFNDTPGAPAAGSLIVEQKGNTITFQRNERRRETLKIDAADSILVEESNSSTKVSMKLSDDKKGLVETRVYTYPETETAIVATRKVRTWRLSPDKKTLAITDDITASNGDGYLMVLVYERQ